MKKNKSKWTMKDGNEIRVCDMGDQHLLNTIAMLERNTPAYINQAINNGLAMSCMMSGEQAQYDIECRMNFLESGEAYTEDLFPIYTEMLNERSRRGLN